MICLAPFITIAESYALLSSLCKYILMLPVSDRQRPFAGFLPHYELNPGVCRVDGDERNAAIVVLPRSHLALPLPEIKHCLSVLLQQIDFAQLLRAVLLRQFGH